MEDVDGEGEGPGVELLSRGGHTVVLDTSEWAAREQGVGRDEGGAPQPAAPLPRD